MTRTAEHVDARRLSPQDQELLRLRVIEALRAGVSPAEVIRAFGVGRTAVYHWRRKAALGGLRALRSRPRGRPTGPRLRGPAAAVAARLIREHLPDELGLPFGLWSCEAVRQLLAARFALRPSARTVAGYLRTWGFRLPDAPPPGVLLSAPVALERARGHQPPGVEHAARTRRTTVYYCSSRMLRSLDRGGDPGQPPDAGPPPARGDAGDEACTLLAATLRRGQVQFMVSCGRLTAALLMRFLARLCRPRGRRVVLVFEPALAAVLAAARIDRELDGQIVRTLIAPAIAESAP